MEQMLTWIFYKMYTFVDDFDRKNFPRTGDVTSIMPGVMHTGMQTFPQPGGQIQRNGIPVENSHFSTISTGLSTRVFLRGGRL